MLPGVQWWRPVMGVSRRDDHAGGAILLRPQADELIASVVEPVAVRYSLILGEENAAIDFDIEDNELGFLLVRFEVVLVGCVDVAVANSIGNTCRATGVNR